MPAAERARVLVIEDEMAICDFIRTELSFEGFEVLCRHDGVEGLLAFRQDGADLVVLDRMLPSLSGIEICQRIRSTSQVPILMLTALGEVQERVEGLRAGADDYLPKPFALEELVARIQTLLRRARPVLPSRLAHADLEMDELTRQVWRGGREVHLAPREFDLLRYFLRHPREVLGRERLLRHVWGEAYVGEDNILDVYISYLRQKLEGRGQGRILRTVRGVGYALRVEEGS